jgi:sugar lactone lactonase YvrE
VAAGAELGEGLSLFPDGQVRWVDLPRGLVHRLEGDTDSVESSYPHEVAKVLPWRDGSVVLGREGLLFRNATLEVVATLRLTQASSQLRCSDGAVLPDGTLLVGIMDREMTPRQGRLVHVTAHGEVHTIVENTSVSNGVAVLAGGSQLIWTDSPTQELTVMDIDPVSGAPGNPRPFATIPQEWGVPDGLTPDSEGGVWVAMWGGGAVRRLDAAGELTDTIEIPVAHVTSVAFDAADNLLVTTAAALLSPAKRQTNPGAGGVWRVAWRDHGYRGLALQVCTAKPPE